MQSQKINHLAFVTVTSFPASRGQRWAVRAARAPGSSCDVSAATVVFVSVNLEVICALFIVFSIYLSLSDLHDRWAALISNKRAT